MVKLTFDSYLQRTRLRSLESLLLSNVSSIDRFIYHVFVIHESRDRSRAQIYEKKKIFQFINQKNKNIENTRIPFFFVVTCVHTSPLHGESFYGIDRKYVTRIFVYARGSRSINTAIRGIEYKGRAFYFPLTQWETQWEFLKDEATISCNFISSRF